MRDDVSGHTMLYGLTDKAFAQVLTEEYDFVDEQTYESLAKLLKKMHDNYTSYSDKNVVENTYTFLKENGIVPEFWRSQDVIAIVRPTGPSGYPLPWSNNYEDKAAHEIVRYALFGLSAELYEAKTVARYIMEYNVPETEFPYVRYYGTVMQNIVSAGLMDAQTIVVVTDNGTDEGAHRYTYPVIRDTDTNTEFRLHFKFGEPSEMTFVTMDNNSELSTLDNIFALTPDEINQTGNQRETNALHFSVGFKSEEEGCFLNSMGMFIHNVETNDEDFIGIIQFKTQVEDEDERYRTLFTNFGIPDPITYPNIFKEQDPEEEGTDWRLVNKKSKELFLMYDQIFPYVGTYKALFNAIRYLGYTDLIFKEWYKIKDSNDKYKYVALQNYDTSTGKAIPANLKKYGIEYGEYDRYMKINRLSMIYHLQEIEQNKAEERVPTADVYTVTVAGHRAFIPEKNVPVLLSEYTENANVLSGDWKTRKVIITDNGYGVYRLCLASSGNSAITQDSTANSIKITAGQQVIIPVFGNVEIKNPFKVIDDVRHSYEYDNEDIPFVRNIYEYRNDEVLAKLFSVKQWIDRHITGVGCYISDLDGESVILERIKTSAYVTGGEFKDITNEGKFTPKAQIKINEDTSLPESFANSSINLTCTLNEFSSVTFADYADYQIERFIKWNYDSDGNEKPFRVSATVDGSTAWEDIYVSAPLNALTVGDEYKFSLRNEDASCGTLYEFTDTAYQSNPIMIRDGEIVFYDQDKTTSKITNSNSSDTSDECPVIQITKGNLREVYGDWSPNSNSCNIAWSIYQATNTEDRTDENVYTYMESADGTHVFRFKSCVNLSPSKNGASLTYTSENKWELPLFVITGYVPTNQMRSDVNSGNERASVLFSSSAYASKQYVLEIIEGRMVFSNHKEKAQPQMCNSAELNFSESSNHTEQRISVSYQYDTERIPIYTFDQDAVQTDVSQTTSYESFNEYYRMLESYTKTNTKVDVPVNRLGNYVVSVTAFDSYNNMFNNESDDAVNVDAARPGIQIILNQANSSNDSDFYGSNVYGREISQRDASTIISSIETTPVFPDTYKIFGVTHDDESETITYDNISYAIDTPKTDDYIALTNMTESAYSISQSSNRLTVNMKYGCPDTQNLYKAESVILCVVDDNTDTILAKEEPHKVYSKTAPTRHKTTAGGADGSIVIDNACASVYAYRTQINDRTNNINLYVLNATEVKILTDLINDDIKNGELGNILYVNQAYKDTFREDTVVKVCIKGKNPAINGYSFHTETAFRIIEKVTVSKDDRTYYGFKIDGHIDPDFMAKRHSLDVYKLSDSSHQMKIYKTEDLEFYINPLHQETIAYLLKVTDDADESVRRYGEHNFYYMKTKVRYNQRQLLFDSYFDDTYAMEISKFDHTNARNMWWSRLIDDWTELNKIDYAHGRTTPTGKLYLYENYPVTVGFMQKICLRPALSIPQFGSIPYKPLWKWSTYAIEDRTNMRDARQPENKTLLFEVRNKVLAVRPDMTGPQFVTLECTDVYGNVIRNSGGGNIFVKPETNSQITSKLYNN